MKRKDITTGTIYATKRGLVKVVDLGPFERTYNGFGDRMTIDGIETLTRRSPEGRHIAVREVRRDGTLAEWIDLATPGMLRPIACVREGLTPDGDTLIVDCRVHDEIGRIPASDDEYGAAEALFARHVMQTRED